MSIGDSNAPAQAQAQPQNLGFGTPTDGGVFGQSANAYSAGTQGLTSAASPYAVSNTMNQFINPYRDQVITDSVSRLRDQQASSLNDVRAQAAQSSAYGGARQGLVEAELMDRYGRNENEMVSRLLQEGYTSNANLSLGALGQQTNASNALIGASQTGFNLGQGALNQQQQAGGQQQMMNQNILSQGAGQFDQYVNYPNTSLATALAGLQGNPLQGQTTGTGSQQFNPGIFNYAQLGASTYAGGK